MRPLASGAYREVVTNAATHARVLPEPVPAPALRRADVDWLKVAGVLLVFVVHAAEPFNPWDTWHIVSPDRTKWLGEVVLLLAPWIMPLFMMLAGEDAWYALAKRSSRAYVRERLLRIALPLAAGVLVLVPPQVYLERRLRGQFDGSLLEFYPRFFDGIYPKGNFGWHHLWFLVFLLAFALGTLPLFQWLRTPAGRSAMARLAVPCAAPGGLIWLVLPYVAIRIAIEVLFPGTPPLAEDWSDRGLLLPAFVFGFMLAGEEGFRRALDRCWRTALLLALGTSTALGVWAWPGHLLDRLPPARSAAGALLWGGYAFGAACWLLALLGGARRHLDRAPATARRAGELVLPFYVLHQPVIVAFAFLAVRAGLGIAPGFALIAAASLAATLALCALVASSDLLRPAFGLRRRSPSVGAGQS